ncbi:hypothetical protein ScPMuIL_012926 [Solemya velum]
MDFEATSVIRQQVGLKTVRRELSTRVSFTANNRYGRVMTTTEDNQYERLSDAVTPLHRKPYERQLKIKKHFMEKALRKAGNIILHRRRAEFDSQMKSWVTENNGLICSLDTVRPSPVIYGYRNKVELSVGTSVTGEPNTVGLFVGKGSGAICVNPYHILSIREDHKEICKVYQEFIRQTKLPSATGDKFSYNNQWKYISMRSTVDNEVMVVIQFYPWLDQPELTEKAKYELAEFFQHGPGKLLDITSLYFQACRMRYCSHEKSPYKLIKGDSNIYEKLLGKIFRISPDSFFQTNTRGAEILYATVQELSGVNSSTTVLDLCCGTGTIGIVLADEAKSVIGVDIVQQAVDDAAVNSTINNLQNCSFEQAKVHKELWHILRRCQFTSDDDVIAILNPSRNGVKSKVVQSIRGCPSIKRLLYVSCKPYGNVLSNFLDLMIPECEKMGGEAFRLTRAKAVDMFPHTLHCELLALFER